MRALLIPSPRQRGRVTALWASTGDRGRQTSREGDQPPSYFGLLQWFQLGGRLSGQWEAPLGCPLPSAPWGSEWFQVNESTSPGASHGELVVKNPPINSGDTRDVDSVPESGRSPGGGHGNLLQ